MAVTDQEFSTLSRRVAALEQSDAANTKSIEFIASTLGGMKAVQDNHTKRLDGIDQRLDGIDQRLNGIDRRLDGIDGEIRGLKADVAGLRADMPGIVAEAMREVLREAKG
jgi:archaellum component FlaC